MARASGSTFYNPDDSNNPVTFKARCKFLKLVLDYDPELAKRFSKDMTRHFFGVDPESYDLSVPLLLPLIVNFLESRKAGELLEPPNNYIGFYDRYEFCEAPSTKISISLRNVSSLVRDVAIIYEETCLRYLGYWTLDLLIRFAIYWNKQPLVASIDMLGANAGRKPLRPLKANFAPPPLNSEHYALILNLEPSRYRIKPLDEKAGPQPSYTLKALPMSDYMKRYGRTLDSEELAAANAKSSLPYWFFEAATGEYLTVRFGINSSSPKDVGHILKKVQDGSRIHYLKRCEAWAREAGLASFQGHRRTKITLKTAITPDERYLHLYLYACKDLTVAEITDQVSSNWKAQGMDRIPDLENIEAGIAGLARHLQMHIEDFRERDRRAKNYKELGVARR